MSAALVNNGTYHNGNSHSLPDSASKQLSPNGQHTGRPSGTTKTVDQKRAALLKRVDAKLRYPELRSMIVVDEQMAFWFCRLCRDNKVKQCGVRQCNTCETRCILDHCTNGIHEALLGQNPALKQLNVQRKQKDEAFASEPPLKRMRTSTSAVSTSTSASTQSQSATSTQSPRSHAHALKAALPAIHAPVLPLFDDDALQSAEDAMGSTATLAPLPAPCEEWPVCALCLSGGRELSRCSNCRQSYYCDRECQVKHWDVHSIVCKPGPPQPPELVDGQPVPPPSHNTAYAYARYGHAASHSHGYSYAGASPMRTPTPYRRRTANSTPQSWAGSTGTGTGTPGGVTPYYCEECNRYFKSGQALGGHRSIHRRDGAVATPGAAVARCVWVSD